MIRFIYRKLNENNILALDFVLIWFNMKSLNAIYKTLLLYYLIYMKIMIKKDTFHIKNTICHKI